MNTCAHKGCLKTPVRGSKYCEYHEAEHYTWVRNFLKFGVPAIATIGGIIVNILFKKKQSPGKP